MGNLYGKLCSFCEERKLIQIFNRNEDSCNFGLGVLICVSETYLISKHIDKQGRPDGLMIEAVDDIWKIVGESRYIDKFKSIMRADGVEINAGEYSDIFNSEKCDIVSFLQYSIDAKRAVTLYFSNPGGYEMSGFAEELNDGVIKFKEVDKYDGTAETAYVNIEDIYGCSCGGKNERLAEV